MSGESSSSPADVRRSGQYMVVARRYRPKSFAELVGQQHVAQALSNAIVGHRVGHAYLFTGARGVGKTSAARIFAKALNCAQGSSPIPDNSCDICQSIDAGDDVDVIEIDGASNRGIEEIRQLRSNVHVRPSRAPYKIYIIDEVHMLTREAFNALLKTLEEPPEHVKFIFCTTDPEKIPVTVLSRCQRFDFAPIESNAIHDRLRFILQQENREADDAALNLLARRAAGSMRDSQSLLEQLLAFCPGRISVQDVSAMLGTADLHVVQQLAADLIRRDAGAALSHLDEAFKQGAEAGQLAEQLLTYFRDMLVATAGGASSLALLVDEGIWTELSQQGRQTGLETLMAAAQILDQSLVRMRQSTHSRMLLELALIRVASLERLDDLAELLQALQSGQTIPARPATGQAAIGSSPAQEKKTPERPSVADTGRTLPPPDDAQAIWHAALVQLDGLLAEMAGSVDRVAILAPNRLVAVFPAGYNLQREGCERPDRKSKIEKALEEVAGRRLSLELQLASGNVESVEPPVRSTRQMKRDSERHELVSRAKEIFDAEVIRVDVPRHVDS